MMNPSSTSSTFTKKSKKWAKESSQLAVAVVLVSAMVVFITGPYLAYRKLNKIRRLFREKRRIHQFRYGHLPKSQPISEGLVEVGRHSSNVSQTSILSLPIEIRRHIYDLAIPTKKVYQPTPGRPKYPLFEYHGPQPPHWPPHQHIRSDEDPPSQALGTILRLGGSYLHPIPAPKRQGCVIFHCASQLICGDMWMELAPAKLPETCFLTDLMRSSRTMYRDLLHHFYARNLFSFFGPESLLYFVRNVSPEGLRLIRYVHLAIPLESEGWQSKHSKALVEKAFRILQEQFKSLEQLDVEVAILWSQPAEAQLIAPWLRDEVFSQLHGLENLVIKISVYNGANERPRNAYDPPEMEELSSWTEPLYASVKKAATSRPRM